MLKDQDVINESFAKTIEIEKYKFELNDLINIYKLVNKIDDLFEFDLDKCDAVVKKFGLDKMRDIYFHESRLHADSHVQLTR